MDSCTKLLSLYVCMYSYVHTHVQYLTIDGILYRVWSILNTAIANITFTHYQQKGRLQQHWKTECTLCKTSQQYNYLKYFIP